MSPAYLSVLIHCHVNPEPLRECTVNTGAVQYFLKHGVIEPEGDNEMFSSSGYKTTERGIKWLEMILETPMPLQRWVDPRGEAA